MFEMRYFYACDQVDKKYFIVYWHPRAENLGDYASKHHEAAHHKLVRPIYLHEENSPRVLVRALIPQQVRALGIGKTPSPRGKRSVHTPSPGGPQVKTAVAAQAFGRPVGTRVFGKLVETPTGTPTRALALVARVFGPFNDLRGCVGNKVGAWARPPVFPTGRPIASQSGGVPLDGPQPDGHGHERNFGSWPPDPD